MGLCEDFGRGKGRRGNGDEEGEEERGEENSGMERRMCCVSIFRGAKLHVKNWAIRESASVWSDECGSIPGTAVLDFGWALC